MPLPATIAQAIQDTVIDRLTLVFLTGAGGDFAAARHAASQMISAYSPQTPDELALAAEIISLQFHTLEALSHASDPELPLNKVLRLRGGAVSLSRESHKARRRLDQLKRIRATTQPAEAAAEANPPQPAIDQALGSVRAPTTSGQNWSLALEKRLAAQIITENLKKNRQDHTSRTMDLNPPAAAARVRAMTIAAPG